MKILCKRSKPGEEGRRRSEGGWTLIELLIVLIILGLLGALVAPNMFKHVEKSKIQAAKTQIGMLGTALDGYRLDVGKYPESLQALRVSPGDDKWNGPYLPRDVPNDPWGHAYEYRAPGEHGDYDLSSLGADGQQGGEGENADIVSWE